MFLHANESVLFLAAVAAFLFVLELSFRLGIRRRTDTDNGAREHIRALQTALVGLLALLLGFNFAMAASRFDARKALIQEEVNSIGTTWLRALLLPAPMRQQVAELLKSYVSARIDFMRAGTDEARIDSTTAAASVIEAQLWKLTNTMVAEDTGGSQLNLFIQSLNQMINVKWTRREMLDNHVPEPVIHLLFAVAVGAVGFIGYSCGLNGQRRVGSSTIFSVPIALVLAMILEFDRPRSGFIRVGEESMLRLQKGIEEFPPL